MQQLVLSTVGPTLGDPIVNRLMLRYLIDLVLDHRKWNLEVKGLHITEEWNGLISCTFHSTLYSMFFCHCLVIVISSVSRSCEQIYKTV